MIWVRLMRSSRSKRSTLSRVCPGDPLFGFGENPGARASVGESPTASASACCNRTRSAERGAPHPPLEGGFIYEADGFDRDHGCAR